VNLILLAEFRNMIGYPPRETLSLFLAMPVGEEASEGSP
jgi:hypothetical protein